MGVKLKTQTRKAQDVIVQGHGNLILLWPQNAGVSAWLEANVDVQQWWGNGIVVEPRFISYVIAGLEHAGFTVE